MTSVDYGPTLPPRGRSRTFQDIEIIIPHTHQSIEKSLPSVVPSSPMMTFIEVIICWATGGDIEVA